MTQRAAYARAGVDVAAGERAVDLMRAAVASTRRPEVLGDVPEHGTTPHEVDESLWHAVGALPDKQRHAVVLRFVGDLPYAEIGALAGTSEAAARQNVRAGLARLREELTR